MTRGPTPRIPRKAVLDLRAKGKSIPAIAKELGISRNSVRRLVGKPREVFTPEQRRQKHLERAKRNSAKGNAKKRKLREKILYIQRSGEPCEAKSEKAKGPS